MLWDVDLVLILTLDDFVRFHQFSTISTTVIFFLNFADIFDFTDYLAVIIDFADFVSRYQSSVSGNFCRFSKIFQILGTYVTKNRKNRLKSF